MKKRMQGLPVDAADGPSEACPMRIPSLLFLLLSLTCTPPALVAAQAAEVRVRGHDILVDGKTFVVKGAAGTKQLGLLAGLGANTIRTYGADEAEVLDRAQAAGLKVILGFWLEHPRRGVDYRDEKFVAAQLAKLEQFVRQHRNHPALLMWGIGNEVEAELADDAQVWPGIERAAKLVKLLDPAHPTMAVLAEAGNNKVAKLKAQAPSIDVLGVNSYGDGLISLPERVRQQGWTGPWLVTELGPRGQWQAAHTPWGAFIEPSSGEKAALLRRYLPQSLPGKAPGKASGHLVFYWGQKQEVTPTWHSLLLPDGGWSETAEAMAQIWGGKLPQGNRAPRIARFEFTHQPGSPWASWPRGQIARARLDVSDPDKDPFTLQWTVLAESTDLRVAGDAEAVPPSYPQAIFGAGNDGVSIQGLHPGAYRLFLLVRDGRGAVATANLPFRVE